MPGQRARRAPLSEGRVPQLDRLVLLEGGGGVAHAHDVRRAAGAAGGR